MQTATHSAFQQNIAGLAALLERSRSARADFYAKIERPALGQSPRYQAAYDGEAWDVIEIATGSKQGFCFKYAAAMKFVDVMEAAAGRKLIGRQ